jgi:hypothetical protein
MRYRLALPPPRSERSTDRGPDHDRDRLPRVDGQWPHSLTRLEYGSGTSTQRPSRRSESSHRGDRLLSPTKCVISHTRIFSARLPPTHWWSWDHRGLEQLQPFPAQIVFELHEAGCVAASRIQDGCWRGDGDLDPAETSTGPSTGRPQNRASTARHGSETLPTSGFPCSFVG